MNSNFFSDGGEHGASGRAPAALRLMVVDDNEDGANAMAMLLELAGHVVLVAHDPIKALKHAEEFAPDACLLDIGLPGMDGNELARRLKKSRHAAHAKLIAITGYGNKYDRASSMAAGFDHYLVKPANTSELIGMLAKITPVSTSGEVPGA